MRKILLLSLVFMPILCLSQLTGTVSVISSSNRSLSVEFKSISSASDIVYGGGVSYFYNKGNVGRDYTGFVSDMSGSYQEIIAREGAIYFLVGNRISNSFACMFRFGMGTTKRYVNGIGLPGRPDELWYVRKRNSEDILCGILFDYKMGPVCATLSWDSFNSFGAGIGISFKYK
jgi:hypothetical protein